MGRTRPSCAILKKLCDVLCIDYDPDWDFAWAEHFARYTVQRADGFGGSMWQMLVAMGFAERQGWNYGGCLGSRHHLVRNHRNEVLFTVCIVLRMISSAIIVANKDLDDATEFLFGSPESLIHPFNLSTFPFDASNSGTLIRGDHPSIESSKEPAVVGLRQRLYGTTHTLPIWQIPHLSNESGKRSATNVGHDTGLFSGQRLLLIRGDHAIVRVRKYSIKNDSR